ncbi:MAG: ABC transporter ATP-binding protein/permease [Beijerinckiaceae bacterium]|nr:ABC transporter ATP-binding protein/permease [Beijerinckiaceae bacterium]
MQFARLTFGFWRGPGSRTAWLLTLALASCLVGKLIVDVGLNSWNRWFFDALERRDGGSAMAAVFAFGGLVVAISAVGVGIVLARERLQVRWREWCTHSFLSGWLAKRRFHRLTAAGSPMPNPEYRISDDVRMATEPVTDFAIGLFTAVLAASTFAGILWKVGGSLDVTLGGVSFTIPAFMVLGAILYGVAMSSLIPIVGRKLAPAAAAKNEAEARFRFEMIRLRENSEGVIMARGETEARRRLDGSYASLVRTWLEVVRQHGRLTWVTNSNGAMIPVVPLVLCAPKYLSGQLTLGEVMQLASAFVQVQVAIAWLVDNYRAIAEWFASARRIVELVDSFEQSDSTGPQGVPHVALAVSRDASLRLERVRLIDEIGQVVVEHADVAILPGERIALAGEPGAGKSVLVRAMAGLWPWGEGHIALPDGLSLSFLPAAPFLPAGSLREALTYPTSPDAFEDSRLRAALDASGAGALTTRLQDVSRWDQTLSATERQRLAFARVLLQKPDIIILEDALAPFDEITQAKMLDALLEGCPNSTLVAVGVRASLTQRFDRFLYLQKGATGGSILVETDATGQPALSVVGGYEGSRDAAGLA